MKNILVPTDFSECAGIATETAIELAKKSGAEIHFLHTLFTPVDWIKISLKKENQFPEVKEKIGKVKYQLNKLVTETEKRGVKAREFLAFDSGREEIDRHIKSFNHDFVVMGSHGAKGIKSIVGSNTQKVLRHSPVPVLVIKKKSRKKTIKNIVFASDFSKDYSKEFKTVTELAKYYGAIIHLLYVNTPYNFHETGEMENAMNKLIKKSGYTECRKNVYNSMSEEKGILNFSRATDVDIIVLLTHGRTGISRFVSPSITEYIANHSDIPVLSIHI